MQEGCESLNSHTKNLYGHWVTVSIGQLGLEIVEEETQKPDRSCETPFRTVTFSSLKEIGK